MTVFKNCPKCQKRWTNLELFLKDPEVQLFSYQTDFSNGASGLFLFTHREEYCLTTLALPVSHFFDLIPDAKGEFLFQAEPSGCPGYCKDVLNLKDCFNDSCRGRYIRKLMQVISQYKM